MNWSLGFSNNSLKFLKHNNLSKDVVLEKIKLVLLKIRGENANIDVRKLHGKWYGFYRIRAGKLRIIAEFNFNDYKIYIEEIDYRGNIYK